MYPKDSHSGLPAGPGNGFGDGFLGAMDDEAGFVDSEEVGLPLIEEEILDPGEYQNVVLEEASLDEPLPGMEKVLIPREEEWDYATADFHGRYTQSVEEDSPSESSAYDYSDAAEGFAVDQEEDDALAVLAALASPSSEPSELDPVDTENAFDEVEDQEEDDPEDIESILAGIGKGGDEDDEEEDGGSSLSSGLKTNFRVDDEDEELLQGFDIDEIISAAIEMGASDIHMPPGRRLRFRVNGNLRAIDRFGAIPAEITTRIEQKIVTHVAQGLFLKHWELETSYTVRSGHYRGRRVRVSVTKDLEEVAMVMRIVSNTIPRPHELEIGPELLEWAELPSGLVLMNGPTGTGKSTTLASIIQEIQATRACTIVTVEKPVEYIYQQELNDSVVYQREVGRDTLSFAAAMDSAMRMDPDVILIGETRNAQEMGALLYAADTGHLTLSTTHARSAAEVITRIKRMFPASEQPDILQSLATHAHGFASQRLCQTVDGNGRFAVREVLTIADDQEIKDLIVQGDDRGIRRLQEGRGLTLDHELVRAVRSGRTKAATARRLSDNPRYFDALLKDAPKTF